ncbi:nitroreductase family protein [Enterocloster bolteae]|uniref:nitroreductase family protein n=1 Tax=Clostridia TaxID=186801 RepID=UPI001D06CED9|nr:MULTISPECIES: nitroreductase family protein [Clostridia]MCB7087873.1 nitroreductase family protein [Enterocloster bolteae]MCH1936819.1 nitroreductase family protein [Enterocloster sp. OA11]
MQCSRKCSNKRTSAAYRIRKFTSGAVSKDILNTILSAGLSAPTAKNKRPYQFCVITENTLLSELACTKKLIIAKLLLPPKVEPITVIAIGWPDEVKELCKRWEPEKIHFNKW